MTPTSKLPMERRDLLLMFICLPGGRYPLDQIRVMKGMFLLTRLDAAQFRSLYEFKPYTYGPFDTQVYQDLTFLRLMGWIASERVADTNQRIFQATDRGAKRFDDLERTAGTELMATLSRIKKKVTSMGFFELLDYIYGTFPKFAPNKGEAE